MTDRPPTIPPDSEHCNGLKDDGTYCTLSPGWGTNHIGTGRCKLHGGMSGRPSDIERNAPPELRPTLRGMRKDIQLLVTEAAKSLSTVEDLREAAAIQTLLAESLAGEVLERKAEGLPVRAEAIAAAQNAQRGRIDATLAVHKVEYDKNNLISKMQVMAILTTIAQTLHKRMRAEAGKLRNLTDEERQRHEKRLCDAVGEAMQDALQTALAATPQKGAG